MKHLTFIAAAAFAVVALPAAADTTTTPAPGGWAEPISRVFFLDKDWNMRTDDDIAMGWAKMTPDEQTMVRDDCKKKGPVDQSVGVSKADAGMAAACAWAIKQ